MGIVLIIDVWPTNQVNGVLGYLPLTASSQLASCTGVIWNALQTMTATTSAAAAGATTDTASGTGGATATGAGAKSEASFSVNAGGFWGIMICMLCGILATLVI
jgi:hypothetical protein